MGSREQTDRSITGTREDAVGFVLGCREWDAWCVLAVAIGVTVSHMQAGWLWILKKGFLHRDISIGNILMLEPLLKLDPSKLFPLGDENENELNKYIKQLEGTVEKMGLSKECHGFVIDGDMAASLDGYFTPRKTGERSVGVFSDVGKPN